MDEFVKQSLLFDFYGDLLTERQKSIFEAYIQENLSLGEIAEGAGISRQGVHDTIKRCQELLEMYEQKLKLVERFIRIKNKVVKIQESAELDEAKRIASEILEDI